MSIWNISYKQLAYSITCHITVASHSTLYYQIVELALPPKIWSFCSPWKAFFLMLIIQLFVSETSAISIIWSLLSTLSLLSSILFLSIRTLFTLYLHWLFRYVKKKNWLGFSLKSFLKVLFVSKCTWNLLS